MTAIIIPRRHYTQPQGRVEVAHELSADLAFAAVGDHMACVAPGGAGNVILAEGSGFTGPEASVYKGGRSLRFFGNGSGNGGLIAFPQVAYVPPPFTVFLHLNKSALVTEAFLSFGGAGAGKGWKICSYLQARGLSLTFGGVADYTIATDWFPVTPGFISTVVTVVGTTATVYTNGRKISKPVGTPIAPVKPLTLGASFNGSAYSDYSASELSYTALWRRAFSEAEAWALVNNPPEQLFRADPIRIYSLPTGAISINSILASNLTQTGARITLGLTR